MIGEVFALAGAALSLDRMAFVALREATGDAALLVTAIVLALLAGLSLSIGQSVVLFANGVSRRRFVLCLLLMAMVFIVGLLVWAGTIRLISTYLLPTQAAPGEILLAICLGQAPLLFGFLVLIPYLGSAIRRILEAYSLVIVVAALSAMFEIRPLIALLIGGLGWAIQNLLYALLQRPLAGMRRWLWQAASGQPVYVPPREVAQMLAERAAIRERQARTP
jgi:hypothetical protein